MASEAATGGAVFAAFPERVLLPERRRTKPDAVVVTANLGAHTAEAVRELLERSGVASRSLPPYAPELNPIELGVGPDQGPPAPAGPGRARPRPSTPRSAPRSAPPSPPSPPAPPGAAAAAPATPLPEPTCDAL